MHDQIALYGVATNNLKGIDVGFPLGKISVVTGVSGSGKSSLVFDSLYSESYRRYVESLSSYARQYIKALPKPSIQRVENLLPAVAVQQHRVAGNVRSTVGTLTELDDLLAVVFAYRAKITCFNCGIPVSRTSPDAVTHELLLKRPGAVVQIVAPLGHFTKIKGNALKDILTAQGFTKVLADGVVHRLETIEASELHKFRIVIDRLQVDHTSRERLREAAEVALRAGGGRMSAVVDGEPELAFSAELCCTNCYQKYRDATPQLFNFNHPLGACANCQGFGRSETLDFERIIPDSSGSIVTEGVAIWNFGRLKSYYKWASESAKKRGFDPSLPFSKYTAVDWEWLKQGDSRGSFDGINGAVHVLDAKKYKPHYRMHSARFRRFETCAICKGQRLSDQALAYQISGRSFAWVVGQTISDLELWLLSLEKSGEADDGLDEAFDEIRARLNYLIKVGLGYLSPKRLARSLSGGELQRIKMARCLGSALTGTLYCLDEPTAGLHARDTNRLLHVIRELKEQGNTVVLVEHERTIIQNADHLIEIGPDAGHLGGSVVYSGPPTREAIARGVRWAYAPPLQPNFDRFITLSNSETHNLKSVTARFAIGKMTVVCGVSGSGKTSLVSKSLYPLLCQVLGQKVDRESESLISGTVGPKELIEDHAQVLMVSQAAASRSSRSNIATYLGIFDSVREHLAASPLAKGKSMSPGFFSFNVSGGRCETCKGLGRVVEDLSFLGEVAIYCPSCEGRRFKDSVLEVTYRGKNLLDILALNISEARELFFDEPAITTALDQAISLGLGYLTLGQSTNSFSGGEAQRIKLLGLLKGHRNMKPQVLIFDEPTTGLSDRDVQSLLKQFRNLTELGNTLVVIEHHLGVIGSADWLVEIGPEAAAKGGEVLYEGAPRNLGTAKRSATAGFLKNLWEEENQYESL